MKIEKTSGQKEKSRPSSKIHSPFATEIVREWTARYSCEKCRDQANRVYGRAQHSIEDLWPFGRVLKDVFKGSETAQHESWSHKDCYCYFESLTEILKRKKFSVLIDESIHIGNEKTLCVVVSFFDEGTNRIQIQTRFWKLVQIYSDQQRQFSTEGAFTAKWWIHSPMQMYLSKNIVRFGSDGCNTMMGKKQFCL